MADTGVKMQGSELPFLSSWQNFYMIIGAAAATLTGLMFVAITLIVGIERHASTLNAGISAFISPTVVHFCAVLLLAGILSAPWPAYSSVAYVLGLLGLGVVLYLVMIMWQLWRGGDRPPPPRDRVGEDGFSPPR